MLDRDDWKLALEDARTRHAAVVNLIFFNDTQAMHLLRLYIPGAIACAAGATASFGNSLFPIATSHSLIGAALVLFVGSYFCYLAMAPATVNMPGRGADFWLWANEERVTRENVFVTYLQTLKEKTAMNNGVNERGARALFHAKSAGIASPIIALVIGVISFASK